MSYTNKFPDIKGLNDMNSIKNQFMSLMKSIDEEENKLHSNTPFPNDILNRLGTLSYAEMVCYDISTIEEWVWDLSIIINRIRIQEARDTKISAWFEGKLAKAIALMPDGLLDYMDKMVKYHKLANQYPVVRYLLDEFEYYQRQLVHWNKLIEDFERKERSLWYRLNQLNDIKLPTRNED